jgi:hypothetical protein
LAAFDYDMKATLSGDLAAAKNALQTRELTDVAVPPAGAGKAP